MCLSWSRGGISHECLFEFELGCLACGYCVMVALSSSGSGIGVDVVL